MATGHFFPYHLRKTEKSLFFFVVVCLLSFSNGSRRKILSPSFSIYPFGFLSIYLYEAMFCNILFPKQTGYVFFPVGFIDQILSMISSPTF